MDKSNKLRGKIVPIRLKQARVAREYTLDNLSAEIGVTKQMISKYELGTSSIDIDNLIRISNILDFPLDFFYKPLVQNSTDTSTIFFRSSAIPKKTQDAMEQKLYFLHEITSFIENYIDLPKYTNDICFPNLLNIDDAADAIEKLTMDIRNAWGLGDKPIANLTNILLKKGFIVSRAYNNNFKIDAYSKSNYRPYILLGSEKDCCVRSRFDLAHELGHSLLHYDIINDALKKKYHKVLEQQANHFASSFLLPATSFAKDIGSITLESFVYLKNKWKVSIAAIVRRCYDLNIIDYSQYTNMNKSISARGWKKSEPLDTELPVEKPKLFKEAFDLIIDNKILSAEACIRDISLSPKEIENFCFLSDNYFDVHLNDSPRPKLSILR